MTNPDILVTLPEMELEGNKVWSRNDICSICKNVVDTL